MEYESVGCFKDSSERAIESVDGKNHHNFLSPSLLSNDYKTRQQAIQKCAVFAMLQRYKMFGIQDGGMCVTSSTPQITYKIYGESQECKSDGKGGPWANQVYRFPERKGKFMSCDNSSGSFKFRSRGRGPPQSSASPFLQPPPPFTTEIQSEIQLVY